MIDRPIPPDPQFWFRGGQLSSRQDQVVLMKQLSGITLKCPDKWCYHGVVDIVSNVQVISYSTVISSII